MEARLTYLIALAVGVLFGIAASLLPILAVVRRVLHRLDVQTLTELARVVRADILGPRHATASQIERRVARRLRSERFRFSSGREYAYGIVTVHLAPEDYRTLSAAAPDALTSRNLTDLYRDTAVRRRWGAPTSSASTVVVTGDAAVPRGSVIVRGRLGTRYADQNDRTVLDDDTPIPEPGEIPAGATLPFPSVDELTTENLDPRVCFAVLSTSDRSVAVSSDQGAVVMGRGSTAALRFDDPGVSRVHATLRHGRDGWSIDPDRLAANGILVDGLVVERPVLLRPRSTFTLGRSVTVDFVTDCPHSSW